MLNEIKEKVKKDNWFKTEHYKMWDWIVSQFEKKISNNELIKEDDLIGLKSEYFRYVFEISDEIKENIPNILDKIKGHCLCFACTECRSDCSECKIIDNTGKCFGKNYNDFEELICAIQEYNIDLKENKESILAHATHIRDAWED